MVHLTIDGREVSVPAGTTIWSAARQAGIAIPVLCHSPRLRPVGVCRVCVVDVGERTLPAACVRECTDGMQVSTSSPRVEQQRRVLTELLMADHPAPCAREQSSGDCELEALARRYGVLSPRFGDSANGRAAEGIDDSSPVIAVDHQACILCDRCIRGCDDVQSNEVIGRTGKGYTARIAFDLNTPMGESTCVSCGECAAVCPTGALTDKPITLPVSAADTAVESVCPYCGVGCAITYHAADNRILDAEGRESRVNHSRLCVKGRYGWDYVLHPQRLTRPLVRRDAFYPKGPLSADVRGDMEGTGGSARKPGGLVDYDEVLPAFREASWEEALDLVASRLSQIKAQHGPQTLAGFGSAKCSNEEAYLFQKLVRAVFGTNNVDHCTRLCHASSVAALMETIGSGAVTNVFGDVARAEVALVTGSNTAENHPVAATFIKEAVKKGTKLVVVDPRRPDLADFATHYAQIKPGTDVALYNAVMHVLIGEGLVDEAFVRDRTEGFEGLKAIVERYDPETAAKICGIAADEIRALARTIGRAGSMIVFWGMGISQHTTGTDNARCLISLCLLTGNVGRPGTGLHPLRGQNNVQGASDAGLIPMVYPDYQPVTDEAVRRKFEQAWGVSLDPKPGLTVVEITHGALEGKIKGMLMMGENPFLSDPNTNKVRRALASLEFLAVQDIFLTETAEFADVILPASSFFEKTGTFTNTDRRVQVGRKVLDAPGEARLDWQVLCEIASRMAYPMHYDSIEDVFAEFAELTNSYKELSYELLGTAGKLWPYQPVEKRGLAPSTSRFPQRVALSRGACPPFSTGTATAAGDYDGEQILFGDRFPTPSGRGKLVPCEFAPAKELPDDEFPFVLNTGRMLEHWHTGSMTRRSKALDALEPEPIAEMHSDDIARLGLAAGERVRVSSRRGQITLKLRSRSAVSPGTIFIPFHFREAAANVLTIDALDPYGKIPEFKCCAVKVEPA